MRHLIIRTTQNDREAVATLVVTRNDKSLRKPIRSLLLGKTHNRKSQGRPSPMGEMGDEGFPDGRYVMVGTGAKTVAVGCPFCLTMISDGVAAQNDSARVLDVAEILAERLQL